MLANARTDLATRRIERKLKPELMDQVFTCLANGGNLITFARDMKIPYSDLAAWISKDDGRLRIYTKGCDASKEWIRQRIINELGWIGLIDVRQIFNPDGTIKSVQDWPYPMTKALSAIDVMEIKDNKSGTKLGEIKKVKFYDKIRALELIGREYGLFIERHRVTLEPTLEELVAGSFEEKAALGHDINEPTK